MQRFAIQAGLILLSLLLHIWAVGGVVAINFALVFLGLISNDANEFETELVIVPIELVEFGELNNIAPVFTPTRPDPEQEDPVATPPEEDPLPEEDPVPEDPVDETLPEDEIEQTNPDSAPEEVVEEDTVRDLDAEPQAKEEAPIEEEPEPKPKPKEEPVVRRQPVDPLAGLLDDAETAFESERETQRKRPEPRPQPRALPEDNTPSPQTARRGAGERTANTARYESLVYNRLMQCVGTMRDRDGGDQINARFKATFNINGFVEELETIEPKGRLLGRSPERVAVETWRRQILGCNFSLPADDFEIWRETDINVGPKYGLE